MEQRQRSRIRFTNRMKALAYAVRQGESVADVGTDHGYVPYFLLRDGISPFVILADISADSLEKARETFRKHPADLEKADFRVGDGLEPLDAGEVSCVILAGLGGMTLQKILEEDPEKTRSFGHYILQPRNASGPLRAALYGLGYDIEKEQLVREGKFICEVFSAVRVAEPRALPYPADDVRWQYPETFLTCGKELAQRRLERALNSIQRELLSHEKNRAVSETRIRKLQEDRKYLASLLAKLEEKE